MRAYKCDNCKKFMDVPAQFDDGFEVVASDVGGDTNDKILFHMSLSMPGDTKRGDYCPECAVLIATNAIGQINGS